MEQDAGGVVGVDADRRKGMRVVVGDRDGVGVEDGVELELAEAAVEAEAIGPTEVVEGEVEAEVEKEGTGDKEDVAGVMVIHLITGMDKGRGKGTDTRPINLGIQSLLFLPVPHRLELGLAIRANMTSITRVSRRHLSNNNSNNHRESMSVFLNPYQAMFLPLDKSQRHYHPHQVYQ